MAPELSLGLVAATAVPLRSCAKSSHRRRSLFARFLL